MRNLNSIILTTTKDDKMNSNIPKVLHKILHKQMLTYAVELSKSLGSENITVVFDEKDNSITENFKEEVFYKLGNDFSDYNIDNCSQILVFFGDMPLITKDSIKNLLLFHEDNNNKISALVKTDMTDVGFYCFDSNIFKKSIIELMTGNLSTSNLKIGKIIVPNENEFIQISNRIQLEEVTSIMKEKINNDHMLNGVTLIDKNTAYIGSDVTIGKDTIIYPNVILEGKVVIGENCVIGSNSRICDSTISNNVNIESSVILQSSVGSFSTVGPFAYIRPHSQIGSHVKIGDFVEIKNAVIGNNTKASHLTYIGDSDIGENINFGCGTVTVNYDGSKKFRTIVEDNAFIGCNTNLVAPVTVKKGAYVAAGSTITDEVPENSLGIARARQVVKNNWTKKH